VVQINDDYYEDLDANSMAKIIDALSAGEKPAIGSQCGRHTSEPAGMSANDYYKEEAAPVKKAIVVKKAPIATKAAPSKKQIAKKPAAKKTQPKAAKKSK